ncbi:GDP-mannose 4,6-dehydratase [Shewanella cyperi]|uniref:GDP-mannose 4,6-dehydratase n=1 Tax=Shewanella cyperi TaxID=2814292 RepID=UPI001A95185C|nr:GDP-mannose 4,6-dehydratase [Shewanella cyperi]
MTSKCVTQVSEQSVYHVSGLYTLACVANSRNYYLEQLDICDPELSAIFQRYKPNAVIHTAAESHVDRSIDGQAELIQINLLCTFKVLEVLREY